MKARTLVFIFSFLFFTLFSSFKTSVQIPDEEFVIRVAQNIVEGKSLDLPNQFPYQGSPLAEVGADKRLYSVYPIGQSLIVAPFYRAAKLLWEDERPVTRSLYVIPALFMSLTSLLIFMFCQLFGASRRVSLIVTALSALGTILWPYSKFLLTESSQTCLLLFSSYLLVRQQRERVYRLYPMALAGISFGLLNAIKPTFLILLPVLAAYLFLANPVWKKARGPALVFSLLFLLAFSPQLAYNAIRFHAAHNFGYSGSHFSTPIFVGLYGLLLSSGKSFFLYSPVTILFFFAMQSFARDHGREMLLFVGIIVVMIVVYARWDIWSGDYCWGPRFLVPLVPFFMIPTVAFFSTFQPGRYRWKTAVLALLIFCSVTVQLLAISSHYLTYLNYFKRNVSFVPPSNMAKGWHLRDHNFDFQFVPEFSPILGQWWVLKNLLSPGEFENTPWKGLGLNRFHRHVPLNARFDVWFLMDHSTEGPGN